MLRHNSKSRKGIDVYGQIRNTIISHVSGANDTKLYVRLKCEFLSMAISLQLGGSSSASILDAWQPPYEVPRTTTVRMEDWDI